MAAKTKAQLAEELEATKAEIAALRAELTTQSKPQVVVNDRVFPQPAACGRRVPVTLPDGRTVKKSHGTHMSRSEAMACQIGS